MIAWMDIIKRPLVTEKAAGLKDSNSQVSFEVSKDASKQAIKAAIEIAYKVKVISVNTMVVRGKIKKVGRYAGKTSSWKKAIATLRKGHKIEIAEGV